MDIEQVKVRKSDLRSGIKRLLDEFSSETGCRVSALQLERIAVTRMSSKCGEHIYDVVVEVDI